MGERMLCAVHPPREETCAAVGRYLSALVTQVAEPCEDGADLSSRLSQLDDVQVRRVLTGLEIVCHALGVRP